MFTIVPNRTELLTSDDMKDIEIYEPIRKYNKQEQSKISVLAKDTFIQQRLGRYSITNKYSKT